jgi:hypothetical protein
MSSPSAVLNGTLPLPTPDSWVNMLPQSKSRLALLLFLYSPVAAILFNVVWQLVHLCESNLPILDPDLNCRCAPAEPTSHLSYFIGYHSWVLRPLMAMSLLSFSSSVGKRYVPCCAAPYALTGVLSMAMCSRLSSLGAG